MRKMPRTTPCNHESGQMDISLAFSESFSVATSYILSYLKIRLMLYSHDNWQNFPPLSFILTFAFFASLPFSLPRLPLCHQQLPRLSQGLLCADTHQASLPSHFMCTWWVTSPCKVQGFLLMGFVVYLAQ